MTILIAIHLFSQRFGHTNSPLPLSRSLSLSLSLFPLGGRKLTRTKINFINVNFLVRYNSAGFELSRNCFNINYSSVQFQQEKEVINGDYAYNILAISNRFCKEERADKRVNSTL